jgi:hypothetical protein
MDFATRFIEIAFAKAAEANETIRGLRSDKATLATERDNYKALYEAVNSKDEAEAARLELAIADMEKVTFDEAVIENPTPVTDELIEAIIDDEDTSLTDEDVENVGEVVETPQSSIEAAIEAAKAAIAGIVG